MQMQVTVAIPKMLISYQKYVYYKYVVFDPSKEPNKRYKHEDLGESDNRFIGSLWNIGTSKDKCTNTIFVNYYNVLVKYSSFRTV